MSDFYNNTHPKARKEHICDICGEKIKVGERYSKQVGTFDGDFYNNCYCLDCEAVLDAYFRFHDEYYDTWQVTDWVNEYWCDECPDNKTCTISYKLKVKCEKVLSDIWQGKLMI